MKINWKVRVKNPYFWIGLLGVILAAMGVDAEMFTSWQAVIDQAKALLANPFMLVSVALAVLGVFIEPTTAGLGDSAQALEYTEPRKERDEEQ